MIPTITNNLQPMLGHSLTEQPWTDIGLGSGEIASSNDANAMIVQICAILEMRLSDVIRESQLRDRDNSSPLSHSNLSLIMSSNSHNVDISPNIRDGLIELSHVPQLLSKQLHLYVKRIAEHYRSVNYHNFEHACHVTISVNKLLSMLFEEEHGMDEIDVAAIESIATPSVCSASFSSGLSTCSRHSFLRLSTSSKASTRSSDKSTTDETFDKSDFATSGSRIATMASYADPVTKFAVVLGALIHDVDHRGIPNVQLVKESHRLAKKYKGKSVAEHHSLSVGLYMLMEPEFMELREILMPTPEYKLKFRKTVIDVLLCTDIASPEQAQLAKTRWHQAFGPSAPEEQLWNSSRRFGRRHSLDSVSSLVLDLNDACVPLLAGSNLLPIRRRNHSAGSNTLIAPLEQQPWSKKRIINVNGDLIEFYQKEIETGGQDVLKSSVILETLMNAADVAHTMQAWDNFLKWNTKLYAEIYAAHLAGRGGDPSSNWFAGQIGFFDFYVLPLARRLARCGFREDTAQSFLRHAQENRRRWLISGEHITKEMIAMVQKTCS